MLTIPLTLLRFIHSIYHSKKIGYLLLIFCAQWIGQSALIQAADTSRAPLVLLGHANSKKNYIVGSLLDVKFMWFEHLDFIQMSGITPVKGEEKRIKEKFHQPLPKLDPRILTRTEEKTIFYDHKDMPYPFYNLKGFGRSSAVDLLYPQIDTQEAHKDLKEILKKPIKGFALHVSYSHLKQRNNNSSLNIMDFLLPYFKDEKAIKQYLAPSVCLVITEFGPPMGFWDSIEKRKDTARKFLRQSMRECYSVFYEAEKQTLETGILAKRKAFYDIFLQHPEQIKPDEKGNFNIDDFKLNDEKIIFFDPKASLFSLHVGDSGQAYVDTTAFHKVVKKFKGISPKAFVSNQKSKLLYLLPVAGAAAGLGYGTYKGYKKKNIKKSNKKTKSIRKENKPSKTDKKKSNDA